MFLLPAAGPSPQTLERCKFVCNLVKKTFSVSYEHLSLLNGRSIEDFCFQENAARYIISVFNTNDKELIMSGVTPEKMDIKLLYKLLRYVCGLAPRENPIWSNKSGALEFLIYFAYSETRALKEAAACTEQNINQRLDNLQEYLGQILDIVMERKEVNLDNIKSEVLKQHTESTIGHSIIVSCSTDISYMYNILTQHLVHRVFVLVYKQLSDLNGKNVCDYIRKNSKIRRPMVFFTPEEKVLLEDSSIQPEKLSICLLHKLLPRVCGLLNHSEWATSPDTIEFYLHCIKQENDNVGMLDGQSSQNHSHQLYRNVEKILYLLGIKINKTKYDLLREMPDEPSDMDDAFLSPIAQENQNDQHSFSHTNLQPGTSSDTTPLIESPPKKNRLSSPQLPSEKAPVRTLTSEDVNILHLFKALCTGSSAANTMIIVYEALNGDINKVEHKIKKKHFTVVELSQLQGDLSRTDITLLYKLVRFACDLAPPNDPIWTTQGDNLEYYLASVKKMRNELAHDITSLTNEELRKKIENLISLLENILIKTGIKSNRNLQDKIQEMKDELQPLSNPPQDLPDINNYYKKMKELKEELESQIVQAADKELHKQYEQPHFKNISPITWCYVNEHKYLTIDKLFTDLEITNDMHDKTNNANSCGDALLSVLPQENEGIGSRIIIVKGVAGVGKTSLCKYLVHLWCAGQKHNNLKGIDLLIYIQCRYVNTSSISTYLKNNLPNTFKYINKDDIIPLLQEPRVLFLVDGYDEARSEAKDLVADILKSFPVCRMIITSRPQWVPKLQSKIHETTSHCMVFNVKGFKKEKRDQFVQKLFTVMPGTSKQQRELCNQFFVYLNELKEQFEAFVKLPLTLALMALLFIDDSVSAMEAQTISQLYRKLTDFMLKRLASQLNTSQDKIREWMLALEEIAWINLKNNQHHLSNRDVIKLKRKGQKLNVDGAKAISSLLNCETQTSLTDYSEVWTFTHNCQQEFFAAESIVDDMIMNDKSLKDILGFHGHDSEDKKLQRLIQVIEFIAGLLSFEKEITREIAKEIIDISLVHAPWSYTSVKRIAHDLFLENPDLKDILTNSFIGQELMEFLDGYDPQSVIWIIENTSIGIPSRVRLRNTITTVLQMGPLLKLLVDKTCLPNVIIVLDHAGGVSKAINFIKGLNELPVTFTLLTWNSNSLSELINTWPWSQPLHLSFPVSVFPLLWWELVICLVKSGLTPISIVYSSSNCRCRTLVEEGTRMLGTICKTDISLHTGDIIISVEDGDNSVDRT
ncbi:uncharacterized protein LOC121855326 [Homarus americanus]|uniref:NACHT, LRR and PYD domains-containing protein 10-like 9 n=1 Tax=Homarus americanus TaxID=6706 RepID=A0A8J5MKT3_HOMAM|nr:uncharacterized protein LOC121855326 [Homarus americanus]XP_042206154.1 uncharacterized protein LOC121855326 [Homarus americanus]KAG7155183.1 NACHT, LRR and PYD domains-containing protein 10-like 9 [Homarus americanus]